MTPKWRVRFPVPLHRHAYIPAAQRRDDGYVDSVNSTTRSAAHLAGTRRGPYRSHPAYLNYSHCSHRGTAIRFPNLTDARGGCTTDTCTDTCSQTGFRHQLHRASRRPRHQQQHCAAAAAAMTCAVHTCTCHVTRHGGMGNVSAVTITSVPNQAGTVHD